MQIRAGGAGWDSPVRGQAAEVEGGGIGEPGAVSKAPAGNDGGSDAALGGAEGCGGVSMEQKDTKGTKGFEMLKPYYDEDGITIYCGDNRRILPLLEEFDLLLTDPPYGLGARLNAGDKNEWSKGFNVAPEWDAQIAPEWVVQMAISKVKAAIIWGGNYYTLPIARGWLGWDKIQEHSSGHYELAWTNLEIPTRMYRKSRVESYKQMGKVHPTQKPEELMGWCLSHAPEAKSVLDPWMGSGTTLVAAKQRGLRAVGIEINEDYCKAAVERLRQGVLIAV